MKVLIIRFSSFGDIVQCSTVVEKIHQRFKGTDVEIHWAGRSEFEKLIALNAGIAKVISIEKKSGINGLFQCARELLELDYDYIYDAHQNLRSNFIYIFFKIHGHKAQWATRKKDRLKRLLLFKLRINLFPRPFKGIISYLRPLEKWGINQAPNEPMVHYQFANSDVEKIGHLLKDEEPFVTLVPSAAWPLKRWPVHYWCELIRILPQYHFIILGGKEDLFCEELVQVDQKRVRNFAGKLSLIESSLVIKKSNFVVCGDTGLLHVADVLNVPGVSLMGPSAFGFTVSSKIKTLEVALKCRPCSKDGSGRCSQKIQQQCMTDLTPEFVANAIINAFPKTHKLL